MELLCEAIRFGRLPLVKQLLHADPALLMLPHPRFGTPLRVACCGADLEIVRYLLDKGAPANHVTPGGGTVLFWACFHKRADNVRLLLERGASALASAQNGLTPLTVAACNGTLEIMQALLGRLEGEKEDLDEVLNEALWGSLSFNRPAAVRLLLQKGADFRVANHKNRSPLEFSRFKGYSECQALLEEEERAYALYRARCLTDDGACINKRLKTTSMEEAARPSAGLLPMYLRQRVEVETALPRVHVSPVEDYLVYNAGSRKRKPEVVEREVAVADLVHGELNDDVLLELVKYMRH